MRRIISARNRRITRSTFHDRFSTPPPWNARVLSLSLSLFLSLFLSSGRANRVFRQGSSRCRTALLTDLHGNDLPGSLRNSMQMVTAPTLPDRPRPFGRRITHGRDNLRCLTLEIRLSLFLLRADEMFLARVRSRDGKKRLRFTNVI